MKEKSSRFIKEVVENNIEGIVAFIERLIYHDGRVNFQYLRKITESNNKLIMIEVPESEKHNDYGIVMGGEVPNSFCPLYEMGYFFQSLLLSGMGTVIINKNYIRDYLKIKDGSLLRKKIKDSILALTEDEILNGIKKPIVSIICSLDTDIEPYRYVKHQLWRLKDESLKKRGCEIDKNDFGQTVLDESLKNIYWVEHDREIAEMAMKSADTLSEVKAIQYYLTIKEFLRLLSIKVENIPLYFNFVPKEEIMLLGPNSEILEALLALHEKKSLKVYSKLIRQRKPWIFTFSCPKCGESSKKVIVTHLKGDCKTVHMRCSLSPKEFRNEAGVKIQRVGCGHAFEVRLPDSPQELYELLKNTSFSINFAARDLLGVIKTTADSPIVRPVTEIGIGKTKEGDFFIPKSLPKGFGDHRELMTSVLAMQYLFVRGLIGQTASQKFRKKNLLTRRELLLLGYKYPTKLYDNEVLNKDTNIYVTDTSALKALEKGVLIEEFFRRSIDLNIYDLKDLLKLRGTSLEELVSIASG